MSDLIGQILITGLVSGAIYSLAASGLGIIFGLFGIINFAHTQYMMFAAVVAYVLYAAGWPFSLAFLAGVLGAVVLGMLTERLLIRPLQSSPSKAIESLFVTFGLSIVIQNGVLMVFGSQPSYFIDGPLDGVMDIGNLTIRHSELFALVLAGVVFSSLFYVLNKTRVGKAILACSQNPDAARIVGIPVKRVYQLAFGIGCGLAGIGGLLWGSIYSVSYLTGSSFLVMSFVLVIMAGPGNIWAILLCSLIIGMTESITAALFDPKWQQIAVLVVFIITVLKFPMGLTSGRVSRRNS